jgi:hypothetical protein
MRSKVIAICGAPYVGKSTIMGAIGKYIGQPNLLLQASETEPNARLDVTYDSINLQFTTRSGAYLYPDVMIPQILARAEVVIYVLEPCLPNGNSLNFTHDYYEKYFDHFVYHAQKLHALWTDIPWIVVLNKIDLARNPPPGISLFPETLSSEIVGCAAAKDIGIPNLWSKLIKTIEQT